MGKRMKMNNDLFEKITQGNPGAISFIKQLQQIDNSQAEKCIYLLRKYDILGSKMYIFWNECCSKDWDVFFQTMKLIENGVVDKKELQVCLSDVRPWHLI